MNNTPPFTRDERTIAVEHASYIWAYNFITFALLIDVVYRSIVLNEAAWDLMGMVIAGGAISAIYQYRQNTLTKDWISKGFLIFLIGMGISAFVIAFLLAK